MHLNSLFYILDQTVHFQNVVDITQGMEHKKSGKDELLHKQVKKFKHTLWNYSQNIGKGMWF